MSSLIQIVIVRRRPKKYLLLAIGCWLDLLIAGEEFTKIERAAAIGVVSTPFVFTDFSMEEKKSLIFLLYKVSVGQKLNNLTQLIG